MSVSVTLRQEKTVLSGSPTLYRVVSWITAADPEGMYGLFKVIRGINDVDERYNGVATLEDFTEYSENSLTRFYVSGEDFGGEGLSVQVGDILRITNASSILPEWFDSFFTSADFTVASLGESEDELFITAAKPFPTVASEMNWTIHSPSEVLRGSGTGDGVATRSDLSKTTYLRRHWTSLLDDVATAESRFAAIKAYVESVVAAAQTHGVTFTGVDTQVYE